jgi:hypothetical protein
MTQPRRWDKIYLYGLLATVAALIPVVLYLIVSERGCSAPTRKGPDPDSPEAGLSRLASGTELFRDAVSIDAGDVPFVTAAAVRKGAQSRQADAETVTLYLPALLLPSRAVIDEAVARLFSAMPPETGTIAAQRLELQVSQEIEGLPVNPPIVASGTIDRDEASVRVTAAWTAGQHACSLELIRTLRTGLLFVKYSCPAPLDWAPRFLPRGLRMRFTSLTVTSSAFVEVRNLAIYKTGATSPLLTAAAATFTSARPVEPDALAAGLLPGLLNEEGGWSVVLETVAGDAGTLAALPPLAAASGLPASTLRAARLEADAAGGLRIEKASLASENLWHLDAGNADCARDGKSRICSFNAASLAVKSVGATVTAPDFTLALEPGRAPVVRCDGWTLTVSSNPLVTARLLSLATEARSLLDRIAAGDYDLPPLALPFSLPDIQIRLERGQVVVPLLPRPVSGISLAASVSGGMVESLEARLCLGKPNCKELDASVALTTDGAGEIHSATLSASGSRVSDPIVAAAPGAAISGMEQASAQCEVHAAGSSGQFKLQCKGSLEGITVNHPKLALVPVFIPFVRAEGEASLDLRKQAVSVSLSKLQLGEVYFRGVLDIERYAGVPAIRLGLDFPEQSCAALLRAVPPSFIPDLEDARLEGSIWFNFGVEVDVGDVRRTLRLKADGDLDRCRAVTLGRQLDVARLNSPEYLHRVVVNGEDLGVDVGPASGSWIPLAKVPKAVQAAIYGTEDLDFFAHNGFRLGLIRRAVILWFERGRFAYGGSTISQQLVKNLFLTRHKTLSRKFQEAIIVWHMEHVVPKDRILELYINCIEYGPKIWGITRAAATYFGKNPTQLSAMEGAFLAGLKPDPGYGYLQYHRGSLNAQWRQNLDRVLKRMLDMGAISMQYYQQALVVPLHFKPRDGAAPPPDGTVDDNRPVPEGQEVEDAPKQEL